jgi:hypothetical protein
LINIETELENGNTAAAKDIELYSAYAEKLYHHSIGKPLSDIVLRQRMIQELGHLSDIRKKVIRINLGLNAAFYWYRDEPEKANYWSSVAEYFGRRFIDNLAQAPANSKLNSGLVLVVGNGVPK